jgi:hypothetical protein
MRCRRILIAVIATSIMFASACARSPQRLDLVALDGQPLSRAVVDQGECEAEFPYTREEATLQAYVGLGIIASNLLVLGRARPP